MPLNPATLTDSILKITDKTNPGFVGFPIVIVGGMLDVGATNAKTAANWSQAAFDFFAQAVVPPPNPAALAAGKAAFQPAMAAAIGPPGSPTAAAALAAGFAAFAAAFAALVVPPIATPPASPLVIPIGPPIADPTPPAASMAAAIFAWAKTGLYTIPPSPPVPWS